MKKEFILNKEEKEVVARKVNLSIRKIVELLKDENKFPISQFIGQRPYKKRPSDCNGFLAAIFRAAEQTYKAGNISREMKESLHKLGKTINDTEISALTNTQIFMTNELQIFDGQHRWNWTIGFLNNQYKVPEQVCNEKFVGLTFEEIQEFYPEFAEAIMDVNFEVVILDTHCINTVAKYFYQMNSGSKKVSATEGMLALKSGTDSIQYYKQLDTVDDEMTFKGRDTMKSFYARKPIESFVRNICYLSNISVSGSPEETIGAFIDVTNGLDNKTFWKDMRNFAAMYSEIAMCNLLYEDCKAYKGHTINALTKVLYIIAKNISQTSTEGYNSLDFSSIREAGKIVRKNQLDISNTIRKKVVDEFFKIGDSVKDTSKTDELVEYILESNPSLGF